MIAQRVRHTVETNLGRALVRLPALVVRRLGQPVELDGQRLDPRVRFALSVLEGTGKPPLHELPLPQARREYKNFADVFADQPPALVDVQRSTMSLEGRSLRYRVYRPERQGGRCGALVFFHGGGGVIGDLDSHDASCRWLCALSRCSIVSVDYRLAPEHPFPAGVEDAVAAFRWVRDNANRLGIEAERIAVGGDSMGATLAAVACHQVRDDDGPPPRLQLLIYPITDSTSETKSRQLFSDGFLLTGDMIAWFRETYVHGADRADPRVSPLLSERFDGLPPALMMTAGFDPLRDEAEAYAQRLREAGGEVSVRRFEGQVHGFFQMTGIDSSRSALVEIATELQRGLRDR